MSHTQFPAAINGVTWFVSLIKVGNNICTGWYLSSNAENHVFSTYTCQSTNNLIINSFYHDMSLTFHASTPIAVSISAAYNAYLACRGQLALTSPQT